MTPNRVYLSIASNIRPEANISAAIARLGKYCQLMALSRCFVTDAIPAPDQPSTKDLPYFINCVALVETGFRARALKFEVLRPLEEKLGRVRTTDKYAPRPIDLDILLFNHEVIQQEDLQIPDPDITKRWFLAQGILDIGPNLQLPQTDKPLQDFLNPLLDQFYAAKQEPREDRVLRKSLEHYFPQEQRVEFEAAFSA